MVAPSRFLVAVVGLAGLAACSRSAPTGDARLQRDLDLARGQGLELAPQGNARATLSADELIPAGNQKRVSLARAPSQRREEPAAVNHAPVTEAPRTVAETPAPSAPARDSAIEPAPATQRPSAAGAISPPPPGGYKSMGEIIRKAPFPINP
jgi:hypothetical protein